MSDFLQLTPEQLLRLDVVRTLCGSTVQTIINSVPWLSVADRLDIQQEGEAYSLKERKGSLGKVIEWIITGKAGNNVSAPDWEDWDVKAVLVRVMKRPSKYAILNTTYAFVENLRLTKCNFDTIQTEEFVDSSLNTKRKMIVILLEKSDKPLLERKIVGVGIIDLTAHVVQLSADFNVVKQLCTEGRAHELHSGRVQQCTLAKTYSSGADNRPKAYNDGTGNTKYAKPRAFYLFKDNLIRLYNPL